MTPTFILTLDTDHTPKDGAICIIAQAIVDATYDAATLAKDGRADGGHGER